MFGWRVAIAVAASATIILTLVITIVFRRYCNVSKQGTTVRELATTTSLPPPQTPTPIQHVFQRGSSTKPLFNWPNHPPLIADAVDNGWSRFGFTNHASSQSTRSSLLGFTGQSQVEIAWEMGEKSAELIQKIRMNPGMKKSSFSFSSMAAKSVIKTALPLPGPPLGDSPFFQQEAYFEITILNTCCSSDDKSVVEGEKIKLMRKFDRNRSSDSTIHFASKSANHALEQRRLGSRGGDRGGMMMCVGMTCSSLVPLKLPGSYRGSIGLNSDGSVYIDGIKLVFGSGKEEWAHKEKVIGCGFNPLQKKVFFTVDSKLAHVVNCKSEGFSNPLYPVIAANADITFLVNLGQASFSYEPSNATRTPNPCFMGSALSSPVRYEDSGELFSMGRIDSGWLNHCATKSSTNSDVYSWYSGTHNSNNYHGKCKINGNEEEDESEADLFEIVLDVCGKSPKVK